MTDVIAAKSQSGTHPRNKLVSVLRLARREPLLHFVAIGFALFVISSIWPASAKRPVVRVTTAEISQVLAYWQAQSLRSPSPQELQGIIQDRIDEEVLYREALRLGLDRDDVIVRRRMAQKLTFLNQDLAKIDTPTPQGLQAYYDTHRQDYTEPDTVSFDQIYFSPERHGADLEAIARTALHRLRENAGDNADGKDAGDPFMLPLSYTEAAATSLSREYGANFADALKTLPVGTWSGPVSSSFGVHLIRVTARRGTTTLPFADVKNEVREAYLAQEREKANRVWMSRLRQKYVIEVEDPAAEAKQ